MEAVRVENFAVAGWDTALRQHLRSLYLGARVEMRNPNVALVRLNAGAWGEKDEAFWSSLKEQGILQRWEPLESVPPEPKHNQAVYEDIGYRIGSGEKLTPKQQEALFDQLHRLEERARAAEHEAKEQRDRADGLAEYAESTVKRHNQFAETLSILAEEAQLTISGDFPEGWTVEDTKSGRIVVRDGPLSDAYRSALRYLRMMAGGSR